MVRHLEQDVSGLRSHLDATGTGAGPDSAECRARLLVQVVAALAHQPGWCTCLPSTLLLLDEVPDYLARSWSFDTFPIRDPAVTTVRTWVDTTRISTTWLILWGGGGRKTGVAAASMRQFVLADAPRTAFFGRATPVREELGGGSGPVLAAWLSGVDLLILDDLDIGWAGTRVANPGTLLLAECMRTRVSDNRPVVLTAHIPPIELARVIDQNVQLVFADSAWPIVALMDGPSLRTGRFW